MSTVKNSDGTFYPLVVVQWRLWQSPVLSCGFLWGSNEGRKEDWINELRNKPRKYVLLSYLKGNVWANDRKNAREVPMNYSFSQETTDSDVLTIFLSMRKDQPFSSSSFLSSFLSFSIDYLVLPKPSCSSLPTETKTRWDQPSRFCGIL